MVTDLLSVFSRAILQPMYDPAVRDLNVSGSTVSSDVEASSLFLYFVVPHEPAEVVAAWRRKSILDRQIVKCQTTINNSKSFQRKHLTEPGPGNRVAPRFERAGDIVHSLRILESSLFDDGADSVVTE
jgi:hypothetical protein